MPGGEPRFSIDSRRNDKMRCWRAVSPVPSGGASGSSVTFVLFAMAVSYRCCPVPGPRDGPPRVSTTLEQEGACFKHVFEERVGVQHLQVDRTFVRAST